MESYHNAETGKYELVIMSDRYGGMKLPQIKTVDLKEAYHKLQMKSYFSQELLTPIGRPLSLSAGSIIESWFAYVVALLFLLVRPEGLFGEKHIDRV